MTVKEQLLMRLAENPDMFLSGESLAQTIGCSRNAIWKAVTALRQEGYPIEAAQNRGYRLSGGTDILSEQALRAHLTNREVSVTVLPEATSTNQVLKQQALAKELPQGSIVIAGAQTEGRGRRGHTFYSPADTGLYMSILLRPGRTIENSLTLTARAAVAVCRAVAALGGPELSIKWVNDLFLNGRKVGGILTEAVTDFETGHMDFVVIGVGLNLFPPQGGYPDDIARLAGSLWESEEKPQGITRCHLAAAIADAMLNAAEDETIMPEYRRRGLLPGPLDKNGLGERVQVVQGTSRRDARAVAITPEGRLTVQYEDGSREDLLYGEVRLKALPDR